MSRFSLGRYTTAWLLAVERAHHVMGCKPDLVLGRLIGCIRPDPAPCVGRLDQTFAQTGTIVLGGVGDDLTAADAVLSIDENMALVTEGRDREIDWLASVRAGLRLGILDGSARVRVLLRRLGGLVRRPP